jgi:hypothetical protein
MLDEAGVQVLLGRALTVCCHGTATGYFRYRMETGETIRAGMFVDTTYEGDLLAAANVSYRVGREPVNAYGESLAGQFQNVSWSNVYQFCRLPLSPYVEVGNAESGLLPEISSEPPGNVGDGDFKVQAYNFRMYLTDRAGKNCVSETARIRPREASRCLPAFSMLIRASAGRSITRRRP